MENGEKEPLCGDNLNLFNIVFITNIMALVLLVITYYLLLLLLWLVLNKGKIWKTQYFTKCIYTKYKLKTIYCLTLLENMNSIELHNYTISQFHNYTITQLLLCDKLIANTLITINKVIFLKYSYIIYSNKSFIIKVGNVLFMFFFTLHI